MPIEIKDILDKLGVNEVDNIEKFNETFDSKFIAKELIPTDKELMNRLNGERYGKLTTKANQLFGFKHSEMKDVKLEEILEKGVEKLSTELNSLKESATKGNDEKLNEIAAQLEQAKKQAKEFEALNGNLNGELEKTKSDFSNQIKSFKINHQLETVKSAIPFKEGITEAERMGLFTILGNKYTFDLDEKENLKVLTKDGSIVSNEKKNGVLTAEDVIKLEAKANNLLKLNNAGTQKTFQTQQTQTVDDGIKRRKIDPRAIGHLNSFGK